MTGTEIVLLIIALLAVAAAVWFAWQWSRSRRLRARFGPEYDATVAREQSSRKAEALLDQREKRVARFHIRPLSRLEAERFTTEWKLIQERFVDEPYRSVENADRLISDAMRTKGYPVADFEQNAEDLSVEHPNVVSNYRAAHAIALRQQGASTEDLRKAMLHYRTLFEDLAGVQSVAPEEVRYHA